MVSSISLALLYVIAIKNAIVFSDKDGKHECPRCHSINSYVFSGKWVKRSIVWLIQTVVSSTLSYDSSMRVPLIKCPCSKNLYRLLPYGVLPRKVYSLSSIVYLCSHYITDDKTTYRRVANEHDNIVHHSTIHGWIGGIGRMYQDFPLLPVLRSCTTSKLLQITNDSVNKTLFDYSSTIKIEIPEQKYKSEKRHDELVSAYKLFDLAKTYFPTEDYTSLNEWYCWLVKKTGDVLIWLFSSRYMTNTEVRPLNTS